MKKDTIRAENLSAQAMAQASGSDSSLKPFQNKKGQKHLRYPTKKQSFSLEKDCFLVGYLNFFWPFLL